VLTVVSGVVAWLLPSILLALLPSGLTASVRTPGGLSVLEVASFGFAVVPIGMLCSQYLFFLSKPRAAVTGAVAGACTSALVTVLLVQGGDLTIASWGLLAGSIVYALITGLASYRALSAGEESFYGSF
jgi:O-antigen/teichoic acid export membrane protein